MQVKSIRIENFRSLSSVVIDDLPRLTILIGRNNSGKSSLISALQAFRTPWTGGTQPLLSDFCAYSPDLPISITLTASLDPTEIEEIVQSTSDSFYPMGTIVKVLASTVKDSLTTLVLRTSYSKVRQGGVVQVVSENSIQTATNVELTRFLRQGLEASVNQRLVALPPEFSKDQIRNLATQLCRAAGAIVANRIRVLGPTRKPADQAQPIARDDFASDASDLPNLLYYHVANYTPEYRLLEDRFRRLFPEAVRILVPPIRDPTNPAVQQIQIALSEDGIASSVPIFAMSSGMKEALSILARIATAPQGSLIAIEEPEVHFHWSAVSEIVGQMLEDSHTKQLVIATHSTQIYEDRRLEPTSFWTVERPARRETVLTHCMSEKDIDQIVRLMRDQYDSRHSPQSSPTV